MQHTNTDIINDLLKKQNAYFFSQQTKSIKFRIEKLKAFKEGIKKYEFEICNALYLDLHKSYQEAYLTEFSIVLNEIDNHIKHLKKWSKVKKVHTPIFMFGSKSKIITEPLGVSLIIAPWNYPFQLLMSPLIGSISAGNCCILKPSPYSENTALIMEHIIKEVFDEEYIALVQGGREINTHLLSKKFDIIFFTGSPELGKIVMQAAAKNLTPVILELGGKSPCIVDKNANLQIAAKRIIWGKTINAGQTCIAPDYLFVHSDVKEELIKLMISNITKTFGENIEENDFFPRIINTKAFDRLQLLMQEGTKRFGGKTNRDKKYIEPCLIDDINFDSAIMQEEIFGPILPILSYNDIIEVIDYVNSKPKPLAFYYFGKNEDAKTILSQTSSGGACINDTIMHVTNHKLPFGGVGNSGMGKYHGKYSLLGFSNQRSVVKTTNIFDLPMKYVPFKNFSLVKKLV